MSAKEMFEELEYTIEEDFDDEGILYSKPILDEKTFGYVDSEFIFFDGEFNNIYFTNKECLTINELQAINKQVEELGWNKC